MNKAASQPLRRCTVLAALMWAPLSTTAQTAPEKAIRARQSSYYLMGQQMARINATVKGDLVFDKPGLQLSAEALDLIGRMVGDNFPAGSDQGSTKAKAEIWLEGPRFKQLAQSSQADVVKLRAAVQTGDLDAVKAAYGVTSKSCKACHDTFKAQ